MPATGPRILSSGAGCEAPRRPPAHVPMQIDRFTRTGTSLSRVKDSRAPKVLTSWMYFRWLSGGQAAGSYPHSSLKYSGSCLHWESRQYLMLRQVRGSANIRIVSTALVTEALGLLWAGRADAIMTLLATCHESTAWRGRHAGLPSPTARASARAAKAYGALVRGTEGQGHRSSY